MLETLQSVHERLVDAVDSTQHRFLYQDFSLRNRLTGLVGPRGVGKTTLLLQYIKEHYQEGKSLYFSADHIYFQTTSLYEFVEETFLTQSIEIFFIDEVHRYPNWSQALKNLYDSFPKMTIVFSGSSSLDLVKGSYDLSRRAKMYYLPGMSFREYLNFIDDGSFKAYTFDQLMTDYRVIGKEITKVPGILGHYHNYLKQGYYPFFWEDPLSYYEKILAIIEKTIHEDIASFYRLNTGNLKYLSKILNYLSTTPPGKISTYNLGKNLGISDKTADAYLVMLSETGLVEIIYPAESGNQGLRKPEKVFFNNTNLHYALGQHGLQPVDIGTVRELAFIQATKNAKLSVFHSKTGNYTINNFIYEIGGKNKTRKQIKNAQYAFAVKDDVITATQGSIPLLYFGFLY